MNYLTEFDLYINIVLIVYTFGAKIFLKVDVRREDTQKNPRDLRKLPATQTPVKNHLQTLVWKTCKE